MSAQPERRSMKPGRRTTDLTLCRVNIRLSTDLYDDVYAEARRRGLTISEAVRLVLQQYIPRTPRSTT
jgi:predicted DNA binding CopG/RHH family protein